MGWGDGRGGKRHLCIGLWAGMGGEGVVSRQLEDLPLSVAQQNAVGGWEEEEEAREIMMRLSDCLDKKKHFDEDGWHVCMQGVARKKRGYSPSFFPFFLPLPFLGFDGGGWGITF